MVASNFAVAEFSEYNHTTVNDKREKAMCILVINSVIGTKVTYI